MKAQRLSALFCSMTLLFCVVGCVQLRHPQVTLQSLLTEMTDTDTIARWPQPEYTAFQASSHSRLSISPDDPTDKGWFSNADQGQFLRVEDNGHGQMESVMMDVDGPGCIVRAWFTCRDPKMDTLRIYLDHASEPVLVGTFQDLFVENTLLQKPLAASIGGGLNLYLPIPYAKHCKVTWSQGAPQSRYYNIEYRTYPRETNVQSYSSAVLEASRAPTDSTALALSNPTEADGKVVEKSVTLESGARATLNLPEGSAAVRRLEVQLPGLSASATETLRSVVISTRFDDMDTVWAPVGDFFGSGVGLNSINSRYCKVDQDGTFACRWVMPYQKSGSVSLHNLGKQPVRARIAATTSDWRWDNRSLHFHSTWRQERAIPTRSFQDWNYLAVSGRGVYLGDSLAVFNPVEKWWGEGDEKIYQDGIVFPTHFGTGTEDYYGYAWGSRSLFYGPYSNQVRRPGPRHQGHTTVSRVRGLDRIPFNSAFRLDMEVWHHRKDTAVDYAVTTYWYGAPNTSFPFRPQPAEATAPISQLK